MEQVEECLLGTGLRTGGGPAAGDPGHGVVHRPSPRHEDRGGERARTADAGAAVGQNVATGGEVLDDGGHEGHRDRLGRCAEVGDGNPVGTRVGPQPGHVVGVAVVELVALVQADDDLGADPCHRRFGMRADEVLAAQPQLTGQTIDENVVDTTVAGALAAPTRATVHRENATVVGQGRPEGGTAMTAVEGNRSSDQSTDSVQAGDEVLAALFFTPEGIADPAPLYHRLRDIAPVHHSGTGTIFLTRFDDCNEVLRDNRFGNGDGSTSVGLPSADPEVAAYRAEQRRRTEDQPRSMLFLDPPEHTRQRRLVSRAFTPRRVEQMRATIADLAHGCVDRLAEAGRADLLDLVGFPLPVAVIGAMVGVPEADWPRFRTLITRGAVGIEPTATVEDLQIGEAAMAETWDYFVDLVAERRARPQDDLLSDLIRVEEEGDQLSEAEIIVVATLLFAAGFETTTNLIGNGMAALLRNPAEMDRLWADESLLPTAVEEMLRWDSPVQFDVRSALQDADLAGEPVAEGTQIVTLLGAANRDPAHFTDPDRFDISRDEGTPMSFAAGIHYCLGANLARAEGQEVFRALRDRFSAIELDGDLVQRPRTTLRGYEAVPVRVTPR